MSTLHDVISRSSWYLIAFGCLVVAALFYLPESIISASWSQMIWLRFFPAMGFIYMLFALIARRLNLFIFGILLATSFWLVMWLAYSVLPILFGN